MSCLLAMFTHGLCCILSVSPRHRCTNDPWLTPGLCCQSCKLGVKYDDCIKLPPATLQRSQARLLIITLVVILIKNLHALKNTKCVHSNPEGQDTSGCCMLKCPCPPSEDTKWNLNVNETDIFDVEFIEYPGIVRVCAHLSLCMYTFH